MNLEWILVIVLWFVDGFGAFIFPDSTVIEEQWVSMGRSVGESEETARLQFEAFERRFNLTLHPSPDLISPTFTIRIRNESQAEYSVDFPSRCLYRSDPPSGDRSNRKSRRVHPPEPGPSGNVKMAAFHLCGRMRGIITTWNDEFFTVEPVKKDEVKRRERSIHDNWHVVKRILWEPTSSDARGPQMAQPSLDNQGFLSYRPGSAVSQQMASKRTDAPDEEPLPNWTDVLKMAFREPGGESSAMPDNQPAVGRMEPLDEDGGPDLRSQGPRWPRNSGTSRSHDVTVETAVFVDASLYSHMKRTQFPDNTAEEITHFVLAMINAVQLLYQDESLGVPVRFQIQRLEMWTQQPLGLQLPPTNVPGSSSFTQSAGIHNIDHYLNRFCRWQSRENPGDDQDPLHWDHALLLTGLDLFAVGRDGFTSHQIVGLAPVGGMCTSTSSCTVNEGRHFESVYVVAHEIGHNLGMKHDGRAAGNDCDSGSFLMSPTLGSGKTTWSPCSRTYLVAFLNTAQARCLRDRSSMPDHLEHDRSNTLPGQRFTADQQCMLRYGRDSRQSSQRPVNEICRDLHCVHPPTQFGDGHRSARQIDDAQSSQLQTLTSHPALEGTHCGPDMWCRRGRCVPTNPFQLDEDSLAESNNSWLTISPCHSGCLYGPDDTLSGGSVGISTQIRNCPLGLSTCTKMAVRYRACNPIKQCASIKKTTVQQYADQICAQASKHDPLLLPRGRQQVSSDGVRACRVWCYLKSGGLFSYGWTFPDGTRCHTGRARSGHARRLGPAQFCLSGTCQEFECDGQAGGQLNFDRCSHSYEESADFNTIHSEYPQLIKWDNPAEAQWITNKESATKPDELTGNGIAIFDVPHAKLALRLFHHQLFNASEANFEWNPWESISPCRSGCMESTRGLQLVQRSCRFGQCQGPTTSVQLCTPTPQECPTLEPLMHFANRVCAEQMGATGEIYYGVQVWPTPDRPDDGCRVHCQKGRWGQLVSAGGESALFPSGTLCDHRRLAYCLSGRCLEFNQDGIPKQ